MKRSKQILCTFALLIVNSLSAQNFTEHFQDKTLRVDYLFSGDTHKQSVYTEELSTLPQWAGRRHHLTETQPEGNGRIEMRSVVTGEQIYTTSFCTLFQEWLTTDEANTTPRAFQNTFLLPFPKESVSLTVSLKDAKGTFQPYLTHTVIPDDILIKRKGETHLTPHSYLLKNGGADQCIDVAILAEGYTDQEMELFRQDAKAAMESILAHEPFNKLKERFNFIAVESRSEDSGVSTPTKGVWKKTVFNAHFDTFYSERYLTSSSAKNIHDALAGIPYEHIIILANTDQYGGGGIFNAFTLTTAHHELFKPVVVHEFGHSFAGLADEYFYEQDLFSDTYPPTVEPWEKNITTKVDFSSKWQKMLKPHTPNPTPVELADKYPVGVFEGAGYAAKGIFRPAHNCRMRTNAYHKFCPVCQQAIEDLIYFYTDL